MDEAVKVAYKIAEREITVFIISAMAQGFDLVYKL